MTSTTSPHSRTWRRFQESLSLILLALRLKRTRADLVYDMLGTHNNLAEQSLFLNLGYWVQGESYDAACTALADELAKDAGLADGQVVLDAGCGFGEASARWSETFSLPRLQALNITKSQLDVARVRWADRPIDFVEGSAMAMPFAAEEFDAILALESSFHFPDRLTFFKEALRVLKPGATLAIADFFPLSHRISLDQRFKEWLGRGFWQIPNANWIGLPKVQKQLESLGFEAVSLRDISPFVFKPFKKFAKERIKDREVSERLHPLLAKVWGSEHSGLERSQYVILVVRKPLKTRV